MKRPKISNTSPATMPGAAINKELDRLEALDTQFTDEMIESGRGHERFTDWSIKDDPLSQIGLMIRNRISDLRHEMRRRYGPNCPSRLPRGFGPLKGVSPMD